MFVNCEICEMLKQISMWQFLYLFCFYDSGLDDVNTGDGRNDAKRLHTEDHCSKILTQKRCVLNKLFSHRSLQNFGHYEVLKQEGTSEIFDFFDSLKYLPTSDKWHHTRASKLKTLTQWIWKEVHEKCKCVNLKITLWKEEEEDD